jgi:hypothetical protein
MKMLAMQRLLLSVLFACSLYAFAQDGISPITANPDLFHIKKQVPLKNNGTFDSTFVYISDTVGLPFFDEFSKNNFQEYATEFSGPNITSQLFHRLLDEVTLLPLAPNTKFTTDKTYRLEVDLIQDTTIQYDFDSTRFFYDPLTSYPVNHINTYGYPPYIIFDTIDIVPNDPDTIWLSNPFFQQDSAQNFLCGNKRPYKIMVNASSLS